MLTALLSLWAHTALADTNRCTADGVFRTRVVLAVSPWREGTLIAEGCVVNADHPGPGDWQRLLFIRNDGGISWSRPLGAQDATGAVWWSHLDIVPQDVDGDNREEIVLRGSLSNCGEGGCVAGDAALYLWPGLSDGGGDCTRRGFEETDRARLLVWEDARYDAPGWEGPSWVRTDVTRPRIGVLLVDENWTALPPASHDPREYSTTVYVTPEGILPHCATGSAPGATHP